MFLLLYAFKFNATPLTALAMIFVIVTSAGRVNIYQSSATVGVNVLPFGAFSAILSPLSSNPITAMRKDSPAAFVVGVVIAV